MGWIQQTSKVVGFEPQVRVKIDASDWRLQSLFRNSWMRLCRRPHCTQARCIHPVMCWEGQASYFGSRAETTASNGRWRKWGSWGEGVNGSTASSPSGVRGGVPAAKRFSCIPEAPDGLSWNLLRPLQVRGACPLGSALNSGV